MRPLKTRCYREDMTHSYLDMTHSCLANIWDMTHSCEDMTHSCEDMTHSYLDVIHSFLSHMDASFEDMVLSELAHDVMSHVDKSRRT